MKERAASCVPHLGLHLLKSIVEEGAQVSSESKRYYNSTERVFLERPYSNSCTLTELGCIHLCDYPFICNLAIE